MTAGLYSISYDIYNMLSTLLGSYQVSHGPRDAATAVRINVFGPQVAAPTVSWSQGAIAGASGSAIALGTIIPSLGQFVAAGSTTTLASVLVSGIPIGARLSDGTNSFSPRRAPPRSMF